MKSPQCVLYVLYLWVDMDSHPAVCLCAGLCVICVGWRVDVEGHPDECHVRWIVGRHG